MEGAETQKRRQPRAAHRPSHWQKGYNRVETAGAICVKYNNDYKYYSREVQVYRMLQTRRHGRTGRSVIECVTRRVGAPGVGTAENDAVGGFLDFYRGHAWDPEHDLKWYRRSKRERAPALERLADVIWGQYDARACELVLPLYPPDPRLGTAAFPFARFAQLAADVECALTYLHEECGVVHGDVKPQNIVGGSRDHLPYVLCDFDRSVPVGTRVSFAPRAYFRRLRTYAPYLDGDEERRDELADEWRENPLWGTQQFVAPELEKAYCRYASDVPLTPVVDYYSFGKTLLLLLNPMEGATPHQVRRAADYIQPLMAHDPQRRRLPRELLADLRACAHETLRDWPTPALVADQDGTWRRPDNPFNAVHRDHDDDERDNKECV